MERKTKTDRGSSEATIPAIPWGDRARAFASRLADKGYYISDALESELVRQFEQVAAEQRRRPEARADEMRERLNADEARRTAAKAWMERHGLVFKPGVLDELVSNMHSASEQTRSVGLRRVRLATEYWRERALRAEGWASVHEYHSASEMSVILDTRTIVGNTPLFWMPDGNGYGSVISEVGRYDAAERTWRATDFPIPLHLAISCARPRIDIQLLNAALESRGMARPTMGWGHPPRCVDCERKAKLPPMKTNRSTRCRAAVKGGGT